MFRQISSPPSFLFHTSLDLFLFSLLMYFLWDLLVTVSSINSDSPQLEFYPSFYAPFTWRFQAPLYLWVPSAFAHHRCGNHGFLCISASRFCGELLPGIQDIWCAGDVSLCGRGLWNRAAVGCLFHSYAHRCSVTLQVDELWASGKFLIQCNSPCVLALTKTLLRNKTDSELEVDGFGKRFLLVRDSSETSKSLSGGLCLYGNKNWCNTDYQGDYAQLKLNSCLYPCDPFVYIQLKARVDTNYSTFFFFCMILIASNH